MELVFPRRVGKVSDRLAVGGPGRRALVHAGRLRQVAWVALFGRDGDDLAPELEDGPGARRRDRAAEDPLRALGIALPKLGEVGRDADHQSAALALGDVEEVERAGLFEDDPSGPGRGREDREILEVGQLLDGLGCAVEREEVELAVAVGPENDALADPHRIDVVRAPLGLGHLLDAVVLGVEDPDPREPAAAVVLPLRKGLGEGIVGDEPAVGREFGVRSVGDFQHPGLAALDGNGEELGIGPVGREARRNEEDGFSVGRESLNDVGGRVPGQALGNASSGRDDIDVRVAVVLAAEGDERPVGGKGRQHFDADVGGQPPDVPALEVGRPEVIGIDEGDAVGRDGRLGQKLRVCRIDGREPNGTGHHDKDER